MPYRVHLELLTIGPQNPIVKSFHDWTEVTIVKITTGNIVVASQTRVVPTSTATAIPLSTIFPLRFIVGPGSELYFGADSENEQVGLISQQLPIPPNPSPSRIY